MARRETTTATGEATAARAERDAAIRDRINAEGMVETLQAALADQASVAAATAASSAVVASAKLAAAEEKVSHATSLATTAELERDAAHRERDLVKTAAVETRVELSKTRATAFTAANDLAVATTLVVRLQANLEQEKNATTTATNELAVAQKETARVISASNEARESRRSADLERDNAIAASAELREELMVQTNAAKTATEKLSIASQEASRATSASKKAAEGCRLAENGQRSAVAAVAGLQIALANETYEATAATEAWAASQQQADRAISEATIAAEGRRLAERKLAAASTSVVQLRPALAEKAVEATTATHQCETFRQEAVLATLAADKIVESRQLAEVQPDKAVAAALELEAEFVAQTTATATATSEGETARKEAVGATLAAKEAELRWDVSERGRKCALATVAELREELEEKHIFAATTASELVASRQEAARSVLLANEAARDRNASEQERTRAVAALSGMRSELEQVKAAFHNATNQLSAAVQDRDALERERNRAAGASVEMHSELELVTAAWKETANQLEISQQEKTRAVLEAKTATLERDRARLERDSAQASLVEVQSALDRAQRKRGTFALEEGNSAATVMTASGVAEMGPTTARKKARFAVFPGRKVKAAATPPVAAPAPAAPTPAPAAAAAPRPVFPNPPDSSSSFGSSAVSGNLGQSLPPVVASPIIAFYRDGGRMSSSGVGGQGPSLAEVLQKSDHWLEFTHDYIQWLFPTRQASRAVRDAPVLTFDDLHEITRHGEHLRSNMLLALQRMMSFYGLEIVQGGDEVWVLKGGNFDPNAQWLKPSDHNALRLTRILTSLRLFQLGSYANALQAFLCGLPELRTHPSQDFWQSA